MKHFFAFSVAIVFVTQIAMHYGLQSFPNASDDDYEHVSNNQLWIPSEDKSDTIGYAISEDGYFVSVPQTRRMRRRKPKTEEKDTWSSSIPLPEKTGLTSGNSGDGSASPNVAAPLPQIVPGNDTETRIKNVLNVAMSQVGNVGGDPYWKWYGFSGHVEWCACFVSWVANQNGLIEKGIIPKFAGVGSGARWFIARNQWKGRDYVPKAGDIIFFDWNDNGSGDHVGFVEKVENNKVYTIEGNSHDTCKRRIYSLTNYTILGYGTPAY